MEVIKACLARFKQASGQKVNYAKSQIYFSLNLFKEEAKDLSRFAGMERARDFRR